MEPAEIFAEATQAANDAQKAYMDKHGEPWFCGFAWVTVRPARGKFVSWCKARKANGGSRSDFGDNGYDGGWQFWAPGSYNGQSMDIKEVGARAFADVLKKHGLKASVGSRAD